MKQHIWIYGKRLAAVLTGIACLCAAAGCSKTNEINDSAAVPANAPVSDSSADSGETPSDDSTADSTAEAGGDTSIHVVAVGDNLVQQCVYQSAQAHSNDGTSYNFDYCYDNIKPLINGDLNIINQETLICGDGFEVSGSNFNFNSPVELGDAVVGMGFNVITMCNNHLLDKGESGLNGCLNYWDQKMQQYPDILACGVYRDYVDMQQHIRTKEFNGKTVAFLSYTENTNGYSLPDNSELEIVYTSQEDIIQQQIAAAKEIADVVVVTCHWGVEDTYTVTDGVKALAQKIIDWGGDVIIGTHPHVAQTMEYLTRPDGTQGFVFYSLGNFISDEGSGGDGKNSAHHENLPRKYAEGAGRLQGRHGKGLSDTGVPESGNGGGKQQPSACFGCTALYPGGWNMGMYPPFRYRAEAEILHRREGGWSAGGTG